MFFPPWLSHWKDGDIMRVIAFSELVPVVLAIEIWGNAWKNRKVLFHVDNLWLITVVINQSCKSKRVIESVRYFILRRLLHNVILKAYHIVDMDKNIADFLSYAVEAVQDVEEFSGPNSNEICQHDVQVQIHTLLYTFLSLENPSLLMRQGCDRLTVFVKPLGTNVFGHHR